MSDPLLSEGDFREYTVDELVEALVARGAGEEVVEIEVQAPDGSVAVRELVQLHVGSGYDTDRAGGYRWLKITARLEPR